MYKIVGKCFGNGEEMVEGLDVEKVMYDGVEELGIKEGWEVIGEDNGMGGL